MDSGREDNIRHHAGTERNILEWKSILDYMGSDHQSQRAVNSDDAYAARPRWNVAKLKEKVWHRQ